jgi:hypothetical protein
MSAVDIYIVQDSCANLSKKLTKVRNKRGRKCKRRKKWLATAELAFYCKTLYFSSMHGFIHYHLISAAAQKSPRVLYFYFDFLRGTDWSLQIILMNRT